MKRFFKVIEKDSEKCSKKPKENENEEEKKQDENEEEATKKEPLKFMTWNANSLLLRVKNNWSEFSNFITTFDPDVIAIQEVRMPAASSSSSNSKSAPKNQAEVKDDTNAAREEKRVTNKPHFHNLHFNAYTVS